MCYFLTSFSSEFGYSRYVFVIIMTKLKSLFYRITGTLCENDFFFSLTDGIWFSFYLCFKNILIVRTV